MKKFIALLMAVLMLASVTVTARAEAQTEEIVDGPEMNLVFASYLAQGCIENVAMQRALDYLSERTGGKITGTVYEAAVLGKELEALEQVIEGTIQVAYTGYSSFANYAPEYSTFGVPYLYTSAAQVQKSFDGPIGQAIQAAYEENGLMFDHLIFRGNRQLTSNKLVTTPEDLKGLKLRLPENKVSMTVWSGLGTLTYAIDSSEVFTALQLGTVDAQENPISSNHSKGLWEVQKYTIMTNHVVDFLGFVWSKDWYDGLTDEYRALVDEALTMAAQWACDEEAANEAVLRAEMEEKGMEFVDVDCSLFAEAAAPSIKVLTDGWAEGVYEQVQEDIASTN